VTSSSPVALITGAGSGLGKGLAQALAGQGWRIAALDVQVHGLDTLAGELAGKSLSCAVADVTDVQQVRQAVAQFEREFGQVDLLIASAGIGRETSALTFRAEDIAEHIQVNLIGVANCIDAVLPGMRRRRQGHLLAISSLASYRGLPLMAGYSASKAGVNALLDSLRVELRPLGITVTTICPGWVRTPMTAPVAGSIPMMEVEEAVGYILHAIKKRKAFYAFPARRVWEVRLLRYLPRFAADWLAQAYLRRAQQTISSRKQEKNP
jgi:NAD(P)-dependent dehydrogenase (short-subunit alcohol dehydrogenase family)